MNKDYAIAFDSANESIAVGLAKLDFKSKKVGLIAQEKFAAHRASNTKLLPALDKLLKDVEVAPHQLACVICGKGPGSFTGVRIALSTAKGIAISLSIPLISVSTLDAVAWSASNAGFTGNLLVVADAMRHEVYTAIFELGDDWVARITHDTVMKLERFLSSSVTLSEASAPSEVEKSLQNARHYITGDALRKYSKELEGQGELLPIELWECTAHDLFCTFQAQWQARETNPQDFVKHHPSFALPVYTRLSNAEENERKRLSKVGAKLPLRKLEVGVKGSDDVILEPLNVDVIDELVEIESELMGTNAWKREAFEAELGHKHKIWWVAYIQGKLIGYAGINIAGETADLLKIAVVKEAQGRGVAGELLAKLYDDALNLSAKKMMLEVRASNKKTRGFYKKHRFNFVTRRKNYYSDGEDALIFELDLYPVEPKIENWTRLMPEKPLILAIETSCDETAAALIGGNGNIVNNIVSSQIEFHSRFGGVVPEIASRKHIEAICYVGQSAVSTPETGWEDLDAIAVTYTPGLVGALVVGVAFAKGVAWALDIPLIGVNHLEGHIYANKLDCEVIELPMLVSLVSGGNTMLVHVKDWGNYRTLGSTIDDAVGEAFDKVAKALGLAYPGGPVISKLAAKGNPKAIDFPRAMLHSGDYNFSLSGLKTAVITYINKEREADREINIRDISASFQAAVIDAQIAKAKMALKETGAKTFCLGGGVASNAALRGAYQDLCKELNARLVFPPYKACTDNAAMIALVAKERFEQGKFFELSQDAYAYSDLDESYSF
ncbi:MAG: tRNA (adenosine(37)-N6)-threonylcarbamoyltransferase complex transferase subunit TsaD [Eggerthellaceae bacterium]|nr:tRNA (adenosine(37)-N6)-threonylcarbamoyltransferase complex transferase subunit TsaD [Eggerthellaceae bacterium]